MNALLTNNQRLVTVPDCAKEFVTSVQVLVHPNLRASHQPEWQLAQPSSETLQQVSLSLHSKQRVWLLSAQCVQLSVARTASRNAEEEEREECSCKCQEDESSRGRVESVS